MAKKVELGCGGMIGLFVVIIVIVAAVVVGGGGKGSSSPSTAVSPAPTESATASQTPVASTESPKANGITYRVEGTATHR